jgi:hypothetical protein
VPPGEREGVAVLPQVVADRDLAAEAVAAARRVEAAEVVRLGLDEDRHPQPALAQRLHHRLLVAEVGERDEHAVDAVGVGRNSAAHLAASAYVSTAPSLVVCSSTITARIPACAKSDPIDFRAPAIRLSGKKSRLPTITPRVTGRVVAVAAAGAAEDSSLVVCMSASVGVEPPRAAIPHPDGTLVNRPDPPGSGEEPPGSRGRCGILRRMPRTHFEESRGDLEPYGFTCEVWEPQPMPRATGTTRSSSTCSTPARSPTSSGAGGSRCGRAASPRSGRRRPTRSSRPGTSPSTTS